MSTHIQWTDETWNPIVGCSKVSAGCAYCYAERHAVRLAGNPLPVIAATYAGLTDGRGRWTGEVRLVPAALDKPLHWRKPRRIFVNSMSDLFHPDVPDEWVDRVFRVVARCPQHTFQVLTKRPERMRAYLRGRMERDWARNCAYGVPSNLWLGTSVEDQQAADERIPHLMQCPAAVRFVSAEPLLGPVDLESTVLLDGDSLDRHLQHIPGGTGLDWVIVGGESGPGARPMHPDWARSLRDQCQAAGIPFFFKAWGAWLPDCLCGGKHRCRTTERPTPPGRGIMFHCGSRSPVHHKLDDREWREMPEGC